MIIEKCPECGETPFRPFLFGQVGRRSHRWWFFGVWPSVSLICWGCKKIVGHVYEDGSGYEPTPHVERETK